MNFKIGDQNLILEATREHLLARAAPIRVASDNGIFEAGSRSRITSTRSSKRSVSGFPLPP